MNSVDNLTLSLLMNKTKYNKYLAQTDPDAHKEKQEFIANLLQNRRELLSITNKLIENPDHSSMSSEIVDSFAIYAKELINHLQEKKKMNELEHVEKVEEEEVLFGSIDESKPTTSSFWSKDQIVKTNAILQTIPKSKRP
uniref:Uncharacterized protein n=1 Tax=viral metagenome TaxID=1070528 RepID=A0A6C0I4G2_9ZZZZ